MIDAKEEASPQLCADGEVDMVGILAVVRRWVRRMTPSGQRVLRYLGLYERIKASWLYRLYWKVADRRVILDMEQETAFYRTIVGEGDKQGLVFDVGANQGYKTGIFLAAGARVVAVEPDPVSRARLEERFLRYRLRSVPVTIVEAAVSDKCGMGTLWIEPDDAAKNTLSRKWVETLRGDATRFGHSFAFGRQEEVVTTTLDRLVRTYGQPRFVKIDVEGHEVAVLKGLSTPVPYLSFEVNLPEFRDEAMKCVALLEGLASEGRFNYVIDCREGFALSEWVPATTFEGIIGRCAESSIEVFWWGCVGMGEWESGDLQSSGGALDMWAKR